VRQQAITSTRGRGLLAAILLSFLVFVALAASAAQGGFLQVDHDARALLQITRQALLDEPMRLVSRLGDSSGLIPLIGLGVGCLWWRHRAWALALPALMIGTGVLQFVSKWAVDRPRPNLQEWGFPSGHVLSVVVFFGLMMYLLCLPARGRIRRWLGGALCGGAVVCVAFSRVYLEAHWVSDVAGGFTLGLAYLLFAIWLAEAMAAVRQHPATLGVCLPNPLRWSLAITGSRFRFERRLRRRNPFLGEASEGAPTAPSD